MRSSWPPGATAAANGDGCALTLPPITLLTASDGAGSPYEVMSSKPHRLYSAFAASEYPVPKVHRNWM
jgi:hypothetical protein